MDGWIKTRDKNKNGVRRGADARRGVKREGREMDRGGKEQG